jgi:hypothetical protein
MNRSALLEHAFYGRGWNSDRAFGGDHSLHVRTAAESYQRLPTRVSSSPFTCMISI